MAGLFWLKTDFPFWRNSAKVGAGSCFISSSLLSELEGWCSFYPGKFSKSSMFFGIRSRDSDGTPSFDFALKF